MNSDTRPIYLRQQFQPRSAPTHVGRSLWHCVQMILAMVAGMMIYHHLVLPVLAPTSYGTLARDYPLFGYWMMVFSMTLPMIAFMRAYHHTTWEDCLEMTLAMFAPLAVLTMLAFGSLIPISTLYALGDPLMFLAMALYMLYRAHDHPLARTEPKAHPRVIHIPVRVEQDEHAWHAETQIKIRLMLDDNAIHS